MLYIIIFSFSFFFVLIDSLTRKNTKIIFVFLMLLISFLSMFRYGSGTDYYGYQYHFYMNPGQFSSTLEFKSGLEMGYQIWMFLFKYLNLNFDIFIFVTSGIMMSLVYVTILRYSNFKLLSFLMFYAVYYNIYINSGIRQGIALSIILYSYYKFIPYKNYYKFILYVLFSSLFHISSLIVLVFVLIIFISKRMFHHQLFNIFLVIGSALFYLLNISSYIVSLLSSIGIHIPYESSGANLLAILLRITFLILTFFVYKCSNNVSEIEKEQIYIYFIGSLLFFSLSDIQIFSRLLEFFTIIEIIFLPNLINKILKKKERSFYTSLFMMIVFVILVKDLNSFTFQQNYYQKGPLQYRYTTIFNKEAVHEYKFKHRLDIFY